MAGKATCPECCGTCIIATDDFNRADAGDPGDDWLVVSGLARIDDQEILCEPGAGNAALVHLTEHPGGLTAPQRVRVQFKFPSGGVGTSEILLILGYALDNSYWAASISRSDSSCATIGLLKVEASASTSVGEVQTIGDGLTADEWHTAELCLDPAEYPLSEGILRCKVIPAGGKPYGNQYNGFDVIPYGLRGGMQGSESVRFDNFRFEWMGGPDAENHTRCPECKTPCEIETSTFTSGVPDSPDDDCKWDGEQLTVIHPEYSVEQHVEATVIIQSGQTAEVRLNMTSSGSEYHWARASLSGSTLTFSIGKTGTTLATDTATFLGGSGTLVICVDYTDGFLDANVNTGLITLGEVSDAIENGVWAARSGTAEFTRFYFGKLDPACEQCSGPASECTGDSMPACIDEASQFWLITPTVIDDTPGDFPPPFDGTGTCSGHAGAERLCADIGSVVLENIGPSGDGPCTGACQWFARINVQTCFPISVGPITGDLLIFTGTLGYDEDADETTIAVRATECVIGDVHCCTGTITWTVRAVWRLVVAGKIDCMNMNYTLPLVSVDMSGFPPCYYDQWGDLPVRSM